MAETINQLKDEDLKNPSYKTYMYHKIEGEMTSMIVPAHEAKDLFDKGWRLSPAEFHSELKEVERFVHMADDICYVMNFLLNIDQCKDKTSLVDFGNSFLQLKLKKTQSVKNLRYQIKDAADQKGLLEKESI